jgi:hypothetical protein
MLRMYIHHIFGRISVRSVPLRDLHSFNFDLTSLTLNSLILGSRIKHRPSTMASADLLAAIQSGKKLKKAVTVDKSAPAIDSKAGGGGGGGRAPPAGGGGMGGIAAAISAGHAAGGMLSAGGAKLKPAANQALGMSDRACRQVC